MGIWGGRAALLAAAMLTLAACAQDVTGQGANPAPQLGTSSSIPTSPPLSSTASTPVSPSTAPSSSTSASGSPTPTATPADTTALAKRLEPIPAGAQSWGDSWAANVTPTAEQFVNRFYVASGRKLVLDQLASQGLTGIANRTWTAADGTQIDIVLLQFATVTGAGLRFSSVVGSAQRDAALSAFSIAGHPDDVRGFKTTKIANDGMVDSRAYAHAAGSTIVIEAFYFTPKTFKIANLTTWLDKQLELAG